MLPRWLTALPRFAREWRDEIVVVALGLVYQAGLSGALAPRPMQQEQVVVRIAAESPRPAMVTAERMAAAAHVRAMEQAAVARATAVRPVAPVAVKARVAPVVRVAPVAAPVAVRVPSVVVAPAVVDLATLPEGARTFVVAPRCPRAVVAAEAGENIAADVAAGVEPESCALRELRTSLEQMRTTMDEARVRAALQKAMAAERALARMGQGPGV